MELRIRGKDEEPFNSKDAFKTSYKTLEKQFDMNMGIKNRQWMVSMGAPDMRDESLNFHALLPKLDTSETSRADLPERASVFVKSLCKC